MACCGGAFDDDEFQVIPSCADIQHVEANGYVEVETIKYRAKLFKKRLWTPRYCVLSQGRLYLYKGKKGKASDPETFVINLHNTLKVFIGSYISRQSSKQSTLELGCDMTIVDKYKRKHKLRFGTGEEREYWTSHLATVTGRALVDISHKPQTKKRTATVKNEGRKYEEYVGEGANVDSVPSENIGANELSEKRRSAKDYLKWLRRRDSMLERRERDLCAEIEANLPVRTNSATRSNVAFASTASKQNESSSSEEGVCSEIASDAVTANEPDDQPSPVPDVAIFEEPIPVDTPPAQSISLDVAPVESQVMEKPAVIKENQPVETDQQAKPCPTIQYPTPPPKPEVQLAMALKSDQASSRRLTHGNTIGTHAKRRTSELIAKMQEIFSVQEPLPRPSISSLRSLTTASGTGQFPAYRFGHPSLYCHKLISPPKPKWWTTSNPASEETRQAPERFKFDRTANPVWRILNEKSASSPVE